MCKDSLAGNKDNVSRMERYVYSWTVVSVKNPTKHVGLVQSRHYHYLIKM